MVSSKTKTGLVIVNGVKTSVRTWGRWLEDPPATQNEDIVLIIPGNPGISTFYSDFAEVIHEKTGHTVWIVGYAGHELPEEMPPFEDSKEKFDLNGQVQHKIEFVERYIPKDARLHLIGHSIGSYLSLNLLADPIANSKIARTYLLFPAIEHMAKTPNGRFMNTFIKPIVPVILFMSAIFTFLPRLLQHILVIGYEYVTFIPRKPNTLKSIIDMIQPSVLRNVFTLAFEEIDYIHERNNTVIKNNVKKIRLLYGDSDGWAPVSYYENIKNDFPDLDCHLSSYEHAYVLRQSKEVGELLAGWITEKHKTSEKL